jgi:hypothetical protein
VSNNWADTTVPGVVPRMKCTQCGGKRVNVRPNWKEPGIAGRSVLATGNGGR